MIIFRRLFNGIRLVVLQILIFTFVQLFHRVLSNVFVNFKFLRIKFKNMISILKFL